MSSKFILINDRIAYLVKALGENQNHFAKSIDVSTPVIHNIIKARRSKPSYEILEKILLTYTKVSADWLLRGEGRIWRKKSDILRNNRPSAESIKIQIIDLADQISRSRNESDQAYELSDLVETLLDENHELQRKILKLHERQEEVMAVLKALKKKT